MSQVHFGGGVAISGCKPCRAATAFGNTDTGANAGASLAEAAAVGSAAAHTIVQVAMPPCLSCPEPWSGQWPIGMSTAVAWCGAAACAPLMPSGMSRTATSASSFQTNVIPLGYSSCPPALKASGDFITDIAKA